MKFIRPLLITALAITMIISMTSCALLDLVLSGDKEYRYQELSLTMDSSFTEMKLEEENRTTYVSLSATGVIIIKETFESMVEAGVEDPASIALEDYRDAFNEANGYNGTNAAIDGLTAFTYTDTTDGTDYKFLVCIYQSETAFWSVQFMSPTADYEKNEADFIKWANTVSFDD